MQVAVENFFAILYRCWNTGTSNLAAAILNIWLPVSIWSLSDGIIEYPDSKNMQIAVGISLLSCIEAEIQVHPVLAAAIFNFWLPVLRWSLPDSAIEFPDAENMGVAVRNFIPRCLRSWDTLGGGNFTPPGQTKV
jgi:hypothetical protein